MIKAQDINNESDNIQLLDVKQVAKYTNLTPALIYQLAWKRMIPSVKIGHCVRFKRAVVKHPCITALYALGAVSEKKKKGTGKRKWPVISAATKFN